MPNTRFIKYTFGILLCCLLAICYVHQEIEIVKTGFLISRHRQELSFLLDQYRSLVYNLSQLTSPRSIEDTLCANDITLCMPETENMRHFDRIAIAYRDKTRGAKAGESFLARIFDRFSTKAEAKVVK